MQNGRSVWRLCGDIGPGFVPSTVERDAQSFLLRGDILASSKGSESTAIGRVKAHSRVRVYEGWMLHGGDRVPSEGFGVARIVFDRILASNAGLMDGGNNYLSFKCLRILCSPLLLLLNMFLC